MKLPIESVGLIVVVSSLLGCGDGQPKPTRVEGLVAYDGEPIDNAVVTFKSTQKSKSTQMARGASAITGADGRFKMTTFNAGDGALPGTYNVTIAKYPQFETVYDASGDIDSPTYTGVDNGVPKPEPRKRPTTTKPAAKTVVASKVPGAGKATATQAKTANGKQPVVVSTSVLPSKYEQPTTSGLTVEVIDGKKIKDLVFDLSD